MRNLETHPELNPATPARQFVSRESDPERDRLSDAVYDGLERLHRQADESTFAALLGTLDNDRPVMAVTAIQAEAGGPVGYEATIYTYGNLQEHHIANYKFVIAPTEQGPVVDQGATQFDLRDLEDLLSGEGHESPKLIDLERLRELINEPEESVEPGRIQRLIDRLTS